MKFATFIATIGVCLSLIMIAGAVKKQIIKEVNICKRYDPHLLTCHCDNINKLIPMLTNGIPEMNLLAIEPVHVEYVRLEVPETNRIHFKLNANHITLHGLSKGRVDNCEGNLTGDNYQMSFKLHVPKVEIMSNYEANARILLIPVEAKGDFNMTITEVEVYFKWNTSSYIKNGKEYLNISAPITALKADRLQMHLSNMFGNNTELNDNINEMINANIDLLFDETKPIILETIANFSSKLCNDFYATFPFDVVFPKN